MTTESVRPTRSIPRGRVLVTGGTGLLGANLVRHLLADGQQVRVMVEPGASRRALDGLDVESVEGDLRDAAAVTAAVRGCARVFHTAAKVSTLSASAGETRTIWDVNVMGTRHVVRAALEAGVARVVVSGSFSSVGFDPDDPARAATEDMPFYPFFEWMPYARTKVLAELETYKAVADGLDAVIAVSTGIIGANDYLPSRPGKVLVDFANGKLRGYIPGGSEFVATDDIARGHMLAMEKGRSGQKYTISTCFMTLDDLLGIFEEVAGGRRPRLRISPGLMSALTSLQSGVLARIFPEMPQRLTPGAIKVLTMNRRADLSKARNELGYEPGDIRQAIREAYEFFCRIGMIHRA
jgi:nucleoside-diphosphate-sugar epimerase